MFTFSISHCRDVRTSVRLPRTRRPLVEDLEGRLLLSGIQGRHIGTSVVEASLSGSFAKVEFQTPIPGGHVRTDGVLLQGGHLGR
jgi:hypothetical protein